MTARMESSQFLEMVGTIRERVARGVRSSNIDSNFYGSSSNILRAVLMGLGASHCLAHAQCRQEGVRGVWLEECRVWWWPCDRCIVVLVQWGRGQHVHQEGQSVLISCCLRWQDLLIFATLHPEKYSYQSSAPSLA